MPSVDWTEKCRDEVMRQTSVTGNLDYPIEDGDTLDSWLEEIQEVEED